MARSVRPDVNHRVLAAVCAALALGASTAAYPIRLSQLLQLPLEQLLSLTITSSATLDGEPHGR